ncbi:MAG: RNA polymerase sigma factor [Planctomycetaceae bacterium]|nr:RNA polymerase sigma factor [Planctomycetaceae bacterium]
MSVPSLRNPSEAGLSDEDFVLALQARDPAAIRHLTDCYLPSIWRFVFFRVNGDRHLAEDIVSETVLAVMKTAAKETEIQNPAAWLRTVAANKINDHFRAAARVQHLIDKAKESGQTVDDDDAQQQQILVERRIEVRRAMDQLPENHRLALEWKYVDRLSVREIAGRLNLTERAVESILYRGRRELRQKLTLREEDDDHEGPRDSGSEDQESVGEDSANRDDQHGSLSSASTTRANPP